MNFLRVAPAGIGACLVAIATLPLRAHEEWHNLHVLYSAKAEFVYPFDGWTPKIAAALLNHYPVPSAEVVFTLSVNGRRQDAGGFTSFPNGGSIAIAPDDFALATVWTGGVYEGRVGAAPAVGETKVWDFRWDFVLAPGVVEPPRLAPPMPPNPLEPNMDSPGVVTAKVTFTNLGDNPVLTASMVLAGTVRLLATAGSPTASNVVVEVATPQSNWFRAATTAAPSGAGPTLTFSQNVPSGPTGMCE